MWSIDSVLRSMAYSLIFVACGNFLCLFSIRERLRIGLFPIVLLTLAQCVAYYGLRVISWLGILPYLAGAFCLYCKVAAVSPQKLLYILLVVVTYLLFSNAVFFLFEGSSYTWGWDDMDTVLLGFATSMGPMAWLLRKRVWPALRTLETEDIPWLWVIPMVFIVMNVILSSSHTQSLLSERLSPVYVLLTGLLAVTTACVCFLMLDILKKARAVTVFQGDMRLIDVQLAAQRKRFEELREHVDTVRVLRHDMRHHIRMLSDLIASESYDAAQQYLREYSEETEGCEAPQVSQNFVGDLIGQRSRERAREAGADITILCALPADCWVADVDLCVVLGNLMENALNACRRQREGRRYIYATAKQEGSEVIITIENSCNLEDPPADVLEEEHLRGTGQGIPSVKAIAQKYGGKATFEKQGDVFYAVVLLYRQ